MTKRIRQEDTKGNKKMIDIIKDGETVKVIKDLTPQQLAILNQKDDLKNYCSELGGFVNMCYIKNELLFNELNLNRATTSRLIYLGTYIDYNNRQANLLVKHGKNNKIEPLTKKDIEKLMGLSKQTFYQFLNEIKRSELIFEVDNKFYLSDKYFTRGKSYFKEKEYTRIFIDTTRFIYENSSTRQHKQLSYIFQLIPFLHYNTNALCKNPDEKNLDNVIKLSLKDICELLGTGTSSSQIERTEKSLLKFKIIVNGKKYHLFKRVILKGEYNRKDYFVVNPMVIWKGRDLESVKETIKFLCFDD